jgi:hypothetical protein
MAAGKVTMSKRLGGRRRLDNPEQSCDGTLNDTYNGN